MKREIRSSVRYVLVVQCGKARRRCSGFACENSFHERLFSFDGYGPGVRFMSVSCDMCEEGALAEQLAHFARKLQKKTDIMPDQVSVHLSSCVVTDNSHHARCPRVTRIRDLIEAQGLAHITEGTYVSARAQARRASGAYAAAPKLEVS